MIQDAYFWKNILLLALGTIAIRGSIIAVSARIKISGRMRDLFALIPAAILPALVAPMVFFHHGKVDWMLGKERGLILIAATVVCYFTRSTLATIAFGLVTLYLVTFV